MASRSMCESSSKERKKVYTKWCWAFVIIWSRTHQESGFLSVLTSTWDPVPKRNLRANLYTLEKRDSNTQPMAVTRLYLIAVGTHVSRRSMKFPTR